VADDNDSRLEYGMAEASELRASYAGYGNISHFLRGTEIITHYTNSRVVKSVRFVAYKATDLQANTSLLFNAADVDVKLGYDVSGGEVIQGSSAKSAETYAALFDQASSGLITNQAAQTLGIGAPDVNGLAPQVINRIGTSLFPAQQAAKSMSLFWNNGADWVKLGGTVDTTNQVVGITTSRLGYFQIRQATQLGDVSLVQVYPRIFTPNGDGANDVVIFQFGEVNITSQALTGEIFDITGGKVAALKPGPDPSTLMWDGKNAGGVVVPGGVYIYQITVNGQTVNGSVVVAK
jgi:hypothetical protein